MTSVTISLARWAAELTPDPDDVALADRSLLDTMAVALAARNHRVTQLATGLPEHALWAVAGHVLDFDDLVFDCTKNLDGALISRKRMDVVPG